MSETMTKEGKTWTKERLAALPRLWADGYSATQIEIHFGPCGPSRNAIIGKIHRLGLHRAARDRRPHARGFRPTTPSSKLEQKINIVRPPLPVLVAKVVLPVQPVADGVMDRPLGISLNDLEPWSCRWPIGDPREPGFGFCGHRKVDGKPYCAKHAAVAVMRGSNAKPVGLPRSLIGRAA